MRFFDLRKSAPKWALIFCVLWAALAHSQSVSQSASYLSPVDESITIRKISLAPFSDNVNGIYSRPIEAKVYDTLEKAHRWDLVRTQNLDPAHSPGDLEEKSDLVKKALEDPKADALIVGKINRGPDGISIEVALFMRFDGQLFAREQVKGLASFNVPEVQGRTVELVQKLVSKVPYQGLILSREGTRVTVNLGARDGVKKDQILSVAQILKLNRHPKFKFVVGSEKELIGKVRLEKVDDTLSFGSIISEKERGVIQRFSKVMGPDFVTYNEKGFADSSGDSAAQGVDEQAAQNLIFGKDAREWVPVNPPSFGKVSLMAGLGSFNYNSTVQSPSLNMTAERLFYLNLKLGAELWITPTFILDAGIKQGVFTADNPRSGSSPGQINISTANYHLKFGYNFLITDDFYGPKVTLLGGFSQYALFVDTTSPLGLTSASYRGLDLGLKGSFPVDVRRLWQLGAGLNLMISPAVSETPQSSGSSASNTVTTYSLFGSRRLGERLEAVASLDFELYSSQFSGAGTRPESGVTSSQRITTLFGGINYLF